MHTINNGFMPGRAAHDVDVRGRPKVGVAFLDRTDPGPDGAAATAARLREYPLLVAGSDWNRDLLLEAGAERVEVLLQGVDPSHFHPAPRRGMFAGRFVVFSGGKLEYCKGQDLVLRAFRVFADRHPDALLLAAWSSPWPGEASAFASAEMAGIASGQVVDVGAVPNRAMPRIMREAYVGLFPNRAEGGTNLVAMECMACGVPAILSANTGHLDLLRAGAGIPLRRQAAIAGDAYRGWGESDVDEAVAALEAVYTDRAAAAAQGARAAAAMAALGWAGQLERLGGLLQSTL